MVTSKKATGKAASFPAGLATGAAVSVTVMLASIAVLTTLISKEMLQWEKVGYGIMLLLIISSWAGASVSCYRIKHQLLLVAALSGVLFFAILIGITALFFGGQFHAVGVTGLLTVGSAVAAGLISARGEGRKAYKKRRAFRR